MEGKQKVALTFAVYQNDALVRRETVAQDIVKVGKDAKSHLRVDDELASRMHAVIEVVSPDDITLIDLGNQPSTKVNGARVNKCKISPHDKIQIGGTKLVLERAEPAASSAKSALGAPREIKVPDGWRPEFRETAFKHVTLAGVAHVIGGEESWSESEAHFALSKLLEHRDRVNAAIETTRQVIAAHERASNSAVPATSPTSEAEGKT